MKSPAPFMETLVPKKSSSDPPSATKGKISFSRFQAIALNRYTKTAPVVSPAGDTHLGHPTAITLPASLISTEVPSAARLLIPPAGSGRENGVPHVPFLVTTNARPRSSPPPFNPGAPMTRELPSTSSATENPKRSSSSSFAALLIFVAGNQFVPSKKYTKACP